jgi:hypothetical protein
MKKIISFCLLASLAFTACRKDTLSPVSESTHASVDDFQSPVSGGSNARRGSADDHLKIAIRKIENKENMYRLVIKMDSIEITEKGETKLIALPKDATVTAGLSIPDDKDPKASKVIFEKNELNFKKQNEKGFTVFVSDPFTTDVNFDYEFNFPLSFEYLKKVVPNNFYNFPNLPIESDTILKLSYCPALFHTQLPCLSVSENIQLLQSIRC